MVPAAEVPAPVGFMRGVGYTITDADDAFLAMVGYTRRDFEHGAIDWRAMTPPEFLHLDEAGMKQAADSGGFTAPYQKEFFRKDGTRVRVLLVCAFVPRRENEWVGYVVDLSARTAAVATDRDTRMPLADGPLPQDMTARLVGELVRERSRMLAMLDNTPAMIWAIDRRYRLLGANKAFLLVSGASGKELEIGDDMFAGRPENIVADWSAWYARAFAGESFVTAREYDVGGKVHIEYHHSPIVAPAGDIIGATVVSVDQTPRYETEARLRASDARFRTLAASLPVGIFLADASGALTYASPRVAEIFGAKPEALAGLGYRELVLPHYRAVLDREWQEAKAEGRTLEVTMRIRREDGAVRVVRLQAEPAEHAEVEAAFVGSIEDETERLALSDRVRQREKMESLGTLAGGIAHDFNNMLSVILGFAELAAAPDADMTQRTEAFDAIRTASLRARDLVQQILAFSRRTERAHVDVDLRALVEESARLLRAAIPSSIELDVRLPPLPVLVKGDAAALQQVIVNLCTNAAHALRGNARAKLVITLEMVDERNARLVVTDNGPGIPAENLDRIFEPFFTTKRVGEGSGMGLAVVHGIVTSHRGEITAANAAGGGAELTVSLPATAGSAALGGPRRSSWTAFSAVTGRVLLVEDETAVSNVVAQALRSAALTVVTCASAEAALAVLGEKSDAFDVVLTDLSMPGMRGDVFARQLATLFPALPCVLMSGHRTDDHEGQLGGSAETRGFLQKPFSVQELVTTVGRFVRSGTRPT